MRIAAVVALVGVGIAGAWAQNAPIDSQSGARTMLALHSPATAAGFGRIERYLLNESASETRYGGRRVRLLTVIDEGNREGLEVLNLHRSALKRSGKLDNDA